MTGKDTICRILYSHGTMFRGLNFSLVEKRKIGLHYKQKSHKCYTQI